LKVHFEEIEFHLTQEIKSAQNRLLIAVAWFTNVQVARSLIERKNRGVNIEIIVDDNNINRTTQAQKLLISDGIRINYIKNLTTSNNLMHNKFCVIDNKVTVTGSYNWTINANSNNENIMIVSDGDIASFYAHEFRRILTAGKSKDKIDFDKNDFHEITSRLIEDFKAILRIEIEKGRFTKGIIAAHNNETVKNKIRETNEELLNNIKSKLGTVTIYLELIGKYGFDFKKKASEDEMADARVKFRKYGTEDYANTIESAFRHFKARALTLLIGQYSNFIKKFDSGEQADKALNIVQFLLNERWLLEKEIRKQ
jgi:hypothetical protein